MVEDTGFAMGAVWSAPFLRSGIYSSPIVTFYRGLSGYLATCVGRWAISPTEHASLAKWFRGRNRQLNHVCLPELRGRAKDHHFPLHNAIRSVKPINSLRLSNRHALGLLRLADGRACHTCGMLNSSFAGQEFVSFMGDCH